MRYARAVTIMTLALLAFLWTAATYAIAQPAETAIEATEVEEVQAAEEVEEPAEAAKEVVQPAAEMQPNPAKASPVSSAVDIYRALEAGKWLVAFGGCLLFIVWGLRFLLMFLKVRWVNTKRGGFILAFGTSFALAVGTAAFAGQMPSYGLLAAAAGAAWKAAGMWGHIKDLKDAKDVKAQGEAAINLGIEQARSTLKKIEDEASTSSEE